MKPLSFLLRSAFAATLVTCSAVTPANAAEEAKKISPFVNDPHADAAKVRATRPPTLINIDFPGGTLAELVAAIARSNETTFNVVGETADLATEIPPLSLRNADHESVAQALNQLMSMRGLSLIRTTQQTIMGPCGPINMPVYALLRRAANEPVMSQSFQLGPYLEKQSIDDIIGAIRALWELNPANRPQTLQLKFHPPTKLLLVSGSPNAISAATQLISTLAREPDKNAPEQNQKR